MGDLLSKLYKTAYTRVDGEYFPCHPDECGPFTEVSSRVSEAEDQLTSAGGERPYRQEVERFEAGREGLPQPYLLLNPARCSLSNCIHLLRLAVRPATTLCILSLRVASLHLLFLFTVLWFYPDLRAGRHKRLTFGRHQLSSSGTPWRSSEDRSFEPDFLSSGLSRGPWPL